MRIKILTLLMATVVAVSLQAQVKVGNNPNTIDNSAMLEVESTTKGLLPPRMTTAQRNAITSPATGLMVFNTDILCLQINLGTPASPNWSCLGATSSASLEGALLEILEDSNSPGGNNNTNGTPVSLTQLQSLPLTGVNPSYITSYQQAIQAETGFSNPPTIAQVQAVISAVNAALNAVLTQIGNEGDSPNTVPSVVTATQLQSLPVTGVNPAYIASYQSYIDANPALFSAPATVAEVQAMITTVNSTINTILTQIGNEGDSPNTVPSVVTVAQLNQLPVTGVVAANEIAYQAYIDANPGLFSAPATVAEVQAMINTVNANVTSILAQIGNEGDSPNTVPSVVTVAQLNQLPVTGVVAANETAYQAYIDANPALFSAPATVAEVQAMINTVNSNINAILTQIGNEGDSPNTVPSVVTAAQLNQLPITGVVAANEIAYQAYIDANPGLFSAPATVAEVQAMVNTVNANVTSILAQIGNEGDSPNTVPSVVTVAQLNQLPVTGVVAANEIAYQAYIDANPALFSAPATVAEVQAMINTVNNNINTILTQIGNEGDSPNTVPSVVTAAQLNQLPITGVVTANEIAYQAYIDANPALFSAPATVAEVQAMVNTVNANVTSILAQIGNEGDSPNTVPSVVTVAQLNQLPVTGVVAANETAYQAYIDANPALFSAPATVAEVQAMINTVNANVTSILTQIGNEGDSPNTVPSVVTVAQLNQLPITGVVAANEIAYQAYIDANPALFSAPATVAEVQAMINTVNANVTSILAQIGNEGDSPNTVPSVVTVAQLNQLPVTGVVAENEIAYQAYIDANPALFSAPATVAEVQAMVNTVNANVTSILAQIGNEGDSPNTVPSVVTVAQLNQLPVTGVVAANEIAYQAYIDANPALFSAPATVAEVQAMINTVNANVTSILTQIGNEGDSPNTVPSVVTVAQLNQLPVTGVVAENEIAYQAYIDANPALFSAPATVAEVQAMINTVNANVTSILTQIGNEGDNPNTVPSVVTVAQLNQLPVTGVVAANEIAYQAYIDANPDNFSAPATVAEVQAMITAVNNNINTILTQIGNEGDNPNTVPSVVTVAQLNQLPVTGVVAANEIAYQAYIDANPDNFSAPATVAEVQAMINTVNTNINTVLTQIGNEGDSPNTVPSVVTASQLQSLPVTGVEPSYISFYQAYIDANPNSFSAPATVAEVQAMITAVNNNINNILTQIGNEGDSPNTVPSVVTVAQLNQLPVTGVVAGNETAYQAYIDANPALFSAPATVAEVQAMITAVNNAGILSSGGTAIVSAYSCNTASAGILTTGEAVSGVTQTITATVTTVGTYSITAVANGVTFTGTGTFAGTGSQTVVLTASGTPTAAGTNSFTLSTTPGCSFNRTTNSSLPANITLGSLSPYFVASVFDQDYTPYTTPTGVATLATAQAADGANEATAVNIQGTLTTTGVTINIPYTVVTASVNLPAFSQTITIPASYTEDGISRDVTFSYSAATLSVGSGSIAATLQAVGGTLNVKKLDIQTGVGNDNLGWLLAQFTYYKTTGTTGTFDFRDIAGIPDRNIANANHVMLYLPVTAEDGNTWLNNNLGADYSNTAKAVFNPAQQATSVNDYNAYGSLFQWGRYSDGHELMSWTSGIAGTTVNGNTTTTSATDTPGNSLFITSASDWRTTQNDNLWQGVAGINNPCPTGFRPPTNAEMGAWKTAAGVINFSSAASSALKLPASAYRTGSTLNYTGTRSFYWTNTVSGTDANFHQLDAGGTLVSTATRASGFSVRCIKDNTPPASISALNCGSATNNGTLVVGEAASGVSTSVPYTGGNGGVQYGATVTSTGVTGLTATLAASTLANGAGSLSFTITGTPASAGTASFAITVGGQSCTFTRTVNNITIPANITLAQNKSYIVASVYDQDYLPYTAPTGAATTSTQAADGANEAVTVNVQGSITTTGVTVKIPVTATGSGTLPAFSATITVPSNLTEDGISRNLTLSWASQAYTSATTTINATIAAVGGTLNAKKLDINAGVGNDALGVLLGSFTYPYNNAGNTTTYTVRDISAIPDRMFGVADNNGNSTTHMMLYLPVVAEDGNIWLNNNLGADYSNINKASFNPAQQATSSGDYSAYGSLVQWGRKPDGHELINYTSSTAGTAPNGETTTKSNNPTDALFIVAYDANWRLSVDDNLWASESSANNPCPVGFRVPSNAELLNMSANAGVANVANANSILKFTLGGYRVNQPWNATNIQLQNSQGYYWTKDTGSTAGDVYYQFQRIYAGGGFDGWNTNNAQGMMIRCIKN